MGSRGVFQPVGQKRLTNIAVVRLKKAGKRFEIACYKNKVGDWRTGIEKDLDEVLQATTIFANVSKGVLSKEAELKAAFGTTDPKAICLEILSRGELQVGEEERKVKFDNLFRDVASVLSEKCVNRDSGRPYTITMMERALRDVHFNPDPKKTAKQQALEVLPQLQQRLPIDRARMRLRLSVPPDRREELLQMLDAQDAMVESSEMTGNAASVVVQVEPGVFRELHTFMQGTMQGRGRVEVLSLAVIAEGQAAEEFASSGRAAAAAQQQQQQQQQQQYGDATAASMGALSLEAQRAPAGAGASPVLSAAAATAGSSARGPAGAAGRRAAPAEGAAAASSGSGGDAGVIYPRGPIASLPEAHASRRERFAELDTLQPGWQVELRSKGDTVEAVFYSPAGEQVGAYATARRAALAAKKAQGA